MSDTESVGTEYTLVPDDNSELTAPQLVGAGESLISTGLSVSTIHSVNTCSVLHTPARTALLLRQVLYTASRWTYTP